MLDAAYEEQINVKNEIDKGDSTRPKSQEKKKITN